MATTVWVSPESYRLTATIARAARVADGANSDSDGVGDGDRSPSTSSVQTDLQGATLTVEYDAAPWNVDAPATRGLDMDSLELVPVELVLRLQALHGDALCYICQEDLLDDDGTALMVHSDADNFANIPERYAPEGADEDSTSTGDAGDRAACGVVEEA